MRTKENGGKIMNKKERENTQDKIMQHFSHKNSFHDFLKNLIGTKAVQPPAHKQPSVKACFITSL
jgi:hypothetical protein